MVTAVLFRLRPIHNSGMTRPPVYVCSIVRKKLCGDIELENKMNDPPHSQTRREICCCRHSNCGPKDPRWCSQIQPDLRMASGHLLVETRLQSEEQSRRILLRALCCCRRQDGELNVFPLRTYVANNSTFCTSTS